MNVQDVLAAAEKNHSFVLASDADLSAALTSATREIHRFAIQGEIDKRNKWRRRRRPGNTRRDGMTKTHGSLTTRRCPTKRELR